MRMATSTKVIGIFFALLLLDLSDAVTIAVQLSKEDGDRLDR
jgi:Pyruvate/2-oxoacid:ferredoxin oxidoreductase gamma subunit